MANAETQLRNLARGQGGYRRARHKITKIFFDNRRTSDRLLTPFLAEKFLSVTNGDWSILPIEPRDWSNLERLRKSPTTDVTQHYLELLTHFITANANTVREMYDISRSVSSAVIKEDTNEINSAVEKITKDKRQSLFSYRIACARGHFASKDLIDYFSHQMSSSWEKKRFLYPLVYYFINLPADRNLDEFLSYVINGDIQSDIERRTIKFLLRDELSYNEPLAFKAYIALLCHPFDACEMLLNHFEIKQASNTRATEFEIACLRLVSDALGNTRSLHILRGAERMPFPYFDRPSAIATAYFDLDFHSQKFLCQCFDLSWDERFDKVPLPPVLAMLARMREQKFPELEDFTTVTRRASVWRFVDAFRLIDSLLTSIFMVVRREEINEVRDCFRLIAFAEAVTPFAITGPAGAKCIEHQSCLPEGMSLSDVEKRVGALLKPSSEHNSRLWIKAVHWELRPLQKAIDIDNWSKKVRTEIRVTPSFLTGIDWRWVDDVIAKLRLTPFRGKANGCYVLLLAEIEDRTRDTVFLRTAMEPIADGKSLPEFVEWLSREYGREAIAFVRYGLTADRILMMKLAPNYTAALSGRIDALKTCIKEFGVSTLLSQSQFIDEWKSLTATLMLMNVGSGQFEIPWDIFRKDVFEKAEDIYHTHESLRATTEKIPILGKSKITNHHRYRNGAVLSYEFENRQWPIVTVIQTIVDAFIEHPSFGIEVLLSTRFRHDAVRREYERELSSIRSSRISGVPLSELQQIIDFAQPHLLVAVDRWLLQHIQTARKNKPDALFDFAPSQEQMEELVKATESAASFEETIDCVIAWLKFQLAKQVGGAKQQFLVGMSSSLHDTIAGIREQLNSSADFRSADVSRVVAAVDGGLSRRTVELGGWFSYGADGDAASFTFEEVKTAADGIFEDKIAIRELSSFVSSATKALRKIDPNKVRLAFDLLCEILRNALKHGRKPCARVRMTYITVGMLSGWRFSTLGIDLEPLVWSVHGERYNSITDEIFREGNSGLRKIAALSATLVGEDVKLRVVKRKHCFHVFVPMWNDAGT